MDSGPTCAAVESGMAHTSGFDRSQLLLLPKAVDDYVGSDNPVRFIDAFVDGLDLVEAGLGGQPKAMGRSGYSPGDLLKLTSTAISTALFEPPPGSRMPSNIEVIWVVADNKTRIQDHRRFCADNRAAFKSVFPSSRCCEAARSVRTRLLAVDGTRIKAVNNKDRNFTRGSLKEFIEAADERLEDDLGRARRRRCRGGERRAHGESGGENRGASREARSIRRDAGGTRSHGREPHIADRSRQPCHGDPSRRYRPPRDQIAPNWLPRAARRETRPWKAGFARTT